MFATLADTAPGQMNDSQLWVIIGVVLFATIYFVVLRPLMRKKKDPLDRAPAFSSLSRQRDVERQMQNLLVELSEMARQITAQLDTRAQKLELLIQEADQKIAQLKNGRANEDATTNDSSQRESFTANGSSSQPVPPPDDPRHAKIYALADQGRDANEIAADLSRPRGEVELILALRNKG